MRNTTLDLSVGYKCGCISRTSENWKSNPLHSSAEPEKVAGLAMGLVCTAGEEVVKLLPEVSVGSGGDGVAVRVHRKASTRSWKGSGWLMLV